MKTRIKLIGFLVLSMMALTACASGPKEQAPASGQPSTAAKKVTIAIATRTLNIGYPFATLPLSTGWYKDEGLDVTVVPGESSPSVMQLLQSGKADLGVVVPDAMIPAIADQKVPVKSIYAISIKNSYVFLVKEDSTIKSVADLKGKKVGHPDLGGGTVPFAKARYKEAKLGDKDVTDIATGYGAQAYEALKNGTVHAVLIWTSAKVAAANTGYKFRELPEADWQNKMYGFNLVATDDFIAKNSDVIAKVGRAFAKSTVYLKTNPDAGVRPFWDKFTEQAPKDKNDAKAFSDDLGILKGQLADMRALELPVDYKWGSQTTDIWKYQQQYLVDAGVVKNPVDPAKLFDNKAEAEFMKFDVQAIVKLAQEAKK